MEEFFSQVVHQLSRKMFKQMAEDDMFHDFYRKCMLMKLCCS